MIDLGTPMALVTGAAGWLGSRLVQALVHGLPDDERFREAAPSLRVRCLIRPEEDIEALTKLSDRIEVIRGDIRDKEVVDRLCDGSHGAILFHTAGIIHPRRRREFYSINLEGTRNVLDSATKAGVRRAVIISSNSPCGVNRSRSERFTEGSPYRPYMHYGRSKMLMERAVHEHQQLGRIQTVILRPPWFYGPGQPPRQTLFFTMIRDGKAPIVGDGNNFRSMCYVDSLCQAMILAVITAQANGKTYWIADARPYTMNEIVDTVERLLESEFGIPCTHGRMRLPNLASGFAFFMDKTIQALGMYNQKIHVLSEMNKTIACDVSRARAELAYTPHVELEEGMRRSIAWVLEKGYLTKTT